MKSKGEKVNCLETRIEQTIDRAVDDWMNDPRINTRCNEHVAQAIVQEFGLTTETHAATHAKRTMTRIISAWEWNNQ